MMCPWLLACGCVTRLTTSVISMIPHHLVKDSSWQADAFSFWLPLSLILGLLEGKGENHVHPPNAGAFPRAGGGGEEGRWQIHSPRKTQLRHLEWLLSLTWVMLLPLVAVSGQIRSWFRIHS